MPPILPTPAPSSSRPAPTSRRVEATRMMGATLIVVAVTAIFLSLYALRGAWFLLFGAIVIGTAARPAIDLIRRTGVSASVAGLVLYLALAASLITIVLLMIPILSEQLGVRATRLPQDLEALQRWLYHTKNPILAHLGDRLAPALSSGGPTTAAPVPLSTALGFVGGVGRAAIGFLLVAIVAFFWTLEGDTSTRALIRLLPVERRAGVQRFIAAAEARVGGYVRGQLLVCVISSTILSLAYLLLGLPYWLPLGLLAGLLEIVPLFGPIIGALPAALVVAGSSPARVVWVLLAVFGNHFFMGYFVAPRVIGRTVGVRPFVVLFSISTFGSLLGVAGAILAIPIAAILQLCLDLVRAPLPEAALGQRDRLGLLGLRARDMMKDVRNVVRDNQTGPTDADSDEAEDLTEAIAIDLERILRSQQQETARLAGVRSTSPNTSQLRSVTTTGMRASPPAATSSTSTAGPSSNARSGTGSDA